MSFADEPMVLGLLHRANEMRSTPAFHRIAQDVDFMKALTVALTRMYPAMTPEEMTPIMTASPVIATLVMAALEEPPSDPH